LFSPALFKELRYRSYVFRMTDPEKSDIDRGTRAKTYVALTELGPEAGLLGACFLPFTAGSEGA
jgi:glucokinase